MIILIIFVGFILRIISINQSFWLDEATSATVARSLNFTEIVTQFSPGDFHPPLYYLVLKLWTIPFGVSEVSTRMLSVIFALGTIYIVYLLTIKLFSKSIAVIASLLFATAPLHIYYSQEARMYSMQTFLAALSTFVFTKVVDKGKLRWWIVFALSLALLGATDYLPLLVVVVFWVYALIQKKNLVWWSKFLLSHIPLAGFFAIWSPVFVKQFASGIGVQSQNPMWWKVLGQSGIKELALVPVKFMLGRISFDNKYIYVGIISFIGILFAFLLFKSIKGVSSSLKERKIILPWLWLSVPVILAFLLGLKLSVFSYFRLIFVLPALYILLAVGLSKVKDAVFPFVFMGLIIVNISFSWMYLSNESFQREDWRRMVEVVNEECSQKNCAVVFPSDSQQEAYRYYAGEKNIVKSEDLDSEKDTVWFVRYVVNISDPDGATQKRIENLNYKIQEEKTFNKVVIWKYTK